MASLDLRLEDSEDYPIQTKKLFSILLDYLQPKTVSTLQSTAASILTLLPKKDIGSTEVWMFGEMCVELAEQIPYYHPLQLKLAGLLAYLQFSPPLFQMFEDKDSKVGKLSQALGGLTRFTTLLQKTPTGHFMRHSRLAESMRDNLNGGPDTENPGHYVNFHAFAANLIERSVMGAGDSTCAIWALRTAHEEVCKENGESRQFVRDELMLAAAQWILWYGQSLFKQVLFQGDVDPDDLVKYWCAGELYHGEGGLSMGRWRFWRNGFEAVVAGAEGEKDGYGEECARVAAKAAEIMKALEENMTF